MKYPAAVIIAILATPAASNAVAGSVVLTSDSRLCDDAPPLNEAAVIQVARSGAGVRLEVTSELNCSYGPGTPELRVWRNAATVLLPTIGSSEVAAACLCQHRLSFDIFDLHEGAKTIYYAQDGTVLGHADIP